MMKNYERKLYVCGPQIKAIDHKCIDLQLDQKKDYDIFL